MPYAGRTKLVLMTPPGTVGSWCRGAVHEPGQKLLHESTSARRERRQSKWKTHPSSLSTPCEHLEEECLLAGLRLQETCGGMKVESPTSTATGIDRVVTGKAS
jgi:hypothetical protein